MRRALCLMFALRSERFGHGLSGCSASSYRRPRGGGAEAVRIIAASAVACIVASPAMAKDVRVQWVEAVNNVVQCNAYHNGWITSTTGPCSGFKPPDTIALGQTFLAEGTAHVIKVIIATQSEVDFKNGDLSIKQGEWYCAAAESAADLDMEGKADAGCCRMSVAVLGRPSISMVVGSRGMRSLRQGSQPA